MGSEEEEEVELQKQLEEVGSKLENLPASRDSLINLLTQAATALTEMEQSPPKAVLDSMQTLLDAIVKPELLKHQDEEAKLLVATCTCEITRITAPEAPYDDDVLTDIFRLFVTTFNGLRDTTHPSFQRRVHILDTVAKYRSFVVMLDLECDELVNEMFKTFFAVASDEHPEIVTVGMETIMAVLLEESEEIGEDLLLIILSILGHNKKDITPAARRLAMSVIKECAGQLEPGIKQFLTASMSRENSSSNPEIDYREVIYDLYRCAPLTLSKVVPRLTKELQTDKIDLRLKAVKLVGELFALQGSAFPQTFDPIFREFLKRSSDKVVKVRMLVLEHVKLCLLSDPFRAEAPKLIGALCDGLLDEDESIRKQAVAAVADVAAVELLSVSVDTIKLVAEHLDDKSLLVKKYTMERLSDIYRTWCLKQTGDYDWIPGRILRCLYDEDIGPDIVEQILCTSLFPVDFSVRDKVKNWVKLFSKFDNIEVEALEKILEQKQRLQVEVQKYLSVRRMHKDNDASDLLKKTIVSIRSMSQCFIDPIKAEANLQLLDQSKDANIWRILTTLLDPNTSSLQNRSLRDELLKIVDEKHALYELLSTLSMKCSYVVYDKDFVKDLLLEVDLEKCDGEKLLTQSGMNILVILARFNPLLLSGIEEDLVHLLEDDSEAIKEGVLHVLAKAGETIRGQIGESSSSLDLILERICLEGSRKQAKSAVHALAAITKDEGLKSLSVLYKRLLDMLEKKTNLPSVLQSLGCIAQTAMPVFETQESKIKGFIRENLLRCTQKTGDKAKESWDDRSELCSTKIFAIKTMVKSYLPVKDAHLRAGIDELLKDLHSILSFGDISKDVESSSVDKAHLKLASAKAIIRLSKHWDKKIPIELFHLTLRTSEVGYPEVRKLFLKKVYQYLKDGSLDAKYVCAFLLEFGNQKSILEEESQNLSNIIQMSLQGKTRQNMTRTDGNAPLVHSEYTLPYIVHVLAHHPSCPNIDECKDVNAYEPLYRMLYVYFSNLARGNEDGKPGNGLQREQIIPLVSALRKIKRYQDAIDANMSKNTYAICDLSLSIIKRLDQNKRDLHEFLVPVSLPGVLYTLHKKQDDEKKEDEKQEENEVDKKNEENIEEDKKEENKEEDKKEQNKEEEQKEGSIENENKEKDDMEVCEGQTWLADEKALAHFESLILDANGDVSSKINEGDTAKDTEMDGNDMPLGKILKSLKAKGSKAKKAAKNGSKPAVKEIENNVDILGMLKEINLDNEGVSNKFDSSNGHGRISSEGKLKRKAMPNDLTNVSVPKRRRSSSAKGQTKRPSFHNSGFSGGSPFSMIKMDKDWHGESKDKVTSGGSGDRGHANKKKYRTADEDDLEKPKKLAKTDSNQKSGPIKKRKRRRVSGLAKCTSDETESKTTNLIGRRIRVWWPMDKAFYEGVVKSYDDHKKKHVVLYDDGEVEVLFLDKERWELIEKGNKPSKRKEMSSSSSPKVGSSKKNNKSGGSSKQNKESANISPSSMVRGKRTPRKDMKRGQKGVSQRAEYLKMGRSKDFETKFKPLDKEELSSSEGGISAGGGDSSKMEKSRSIEKHVKDEESSSSDAASSQENELDTQNVIIPSDGEGSNESNKKEANTMNKSDSEENEEDSANSYSTRKGPASENSDMAVFSDDEPIGVWKARAVVGK